MKLAHGGAARCGRQRGTGRERSPPIRPFARLPPARVPATMAAPPAPSSLRPARPRPRGRPRPAHETLADTLLRTTRRRRRVEKPRCGRGAGARSPSGQQQPSMRVFHTAASKPWAPPRQPLVAGHPLRLQLPFSFRKKIKGAVQGIEPWLPRVCRVEARAVRGPRARSAEGD